MKSSFPKSVKHHSKKWACNVSAKFYYYILEKGIWNMNKCVDMYIFMKSSFAKMISELGIAIATLIFGFALNAFCKRALHISCYRIHWIYLKESETIKSNSSRYSCRRIQCILPIHHDFLWFLVICSVAFVCLLLYYAIATVFQLYHSVIWRMRWEGENPEPTLLQTQGIFKLQHHIGMV